MKTIGRFILFLFSIASIGAVVGIILLAGIVYKYGQNLPSFDELKDYKPSLVTRVHAGDGRFLAEFAQEKRIFVPIAEVPPLIIEAFTSAEDKDFYSHKGIDPKAIARAVLVNLKNHGSGRRLVGASTITQQVAKNFLLTNEVRFERKIREAILAYKLENTLSKDAILELYLNQIFLGNRSFGVAAAGLSYFNKPLNELNIAEAAFLAALPKAPNNYNPITHHDEAVGRRNWVIDRMVENGHITREEADIAQKMPLVTIEREDSDVVDAPYFAEEVRRQLEKEFGAEELYRGGLSVRTTLSPRLQDYAETALQNGLMAYDRRHGWRGAYKTGLDTVNFSTTLRNLGTPATLLSKWEMAIILSSDGKIGLSNGKTSVLDGDDVKWANASSRPLKSGDAVMIEPITIKDDENAQITYRLRQVPVVSGGLVAIDPHTGRILAMQGGWKSSGNDFNRATQAMRQPGSAFKPFVYLAALDQGYTPSTLINDSPIAFTDTAGNVWKPENYHGDFLGPTPLRVGVEKSRNLMTIRLAQKIGIDTVVDYAKRFNIDDKMPANLANVLGADETTLMKLTTAYGMIVNGGKRITPHIIDRIQDRNGKTIQNIDTRSCLGCGPLIKWENQSPPDVAENREQVADPRTAYQMVSILEGVVQRGTARSLAALDRPLAGKTGTTNESKDAWFIGFTPDLVVGVYVGYDTPKTLGKTETGSSVAVPIFKEFMEKALEGTPPTPFRVPEGVRLVQVNAHTGQPTYATDPNAIWEPFVDGTEPGQGYYPPNNNSDYQGENDQPYDEPYIQEPLPADEIMRPNNAPSRPTSFEGTGGVY